MVNTAMPMDVKFFGQYLLEKNLISRDHLLTAMALQNDTNLSLGLIALKEGVIDRATLHRIQDYQVRNNVSFVAACNQLQAIPPESMDRLITRQMSHNVLLGEALVRNHSLTREAMDAHYRNFRKEQSAMEFQILQSITTHPHADLIGIAIQSLTNLFRYLMNCHVRLSAFEESEDGVPSAYDWVIYQKIQGDYDFIFELFTREPLALKIASSLARKTLPEMDELGMDALKEFGNVVVGYICSMLSLRNVRCEPDVPLIQRAGDKPSLGHALHLELLVPEDAISMNLVFQESPVIP